MFNSIFRTLNKGSVSAKPLVLTTWTRSSTWRTRPWNMKAKTDIFLCASYTGQRKETTDISKLGTLLSSSEAVKVNPCFRRQSLELLRYVTPSSCTRVTTSLSASNTNQPSTVTFWNESITSSDRKQLNANLATINCALCCNGSWWSGAVARRSVMLFFFIWLVFFWVRILQRVSECLIWRSTPPTARVLRFRTFSVLYCIQFLMPNFLSLHQFKSAFSAVLARIPRNNSSCRFTFLHAGHKSSSFKVITLTNKYKQPVKI